MNPLNKYPLQKGMIKLHIADNLLMKKLSSNTRLFNSDDNLCI